MFGSFKVQPVENTDNSPLEMQDMACPKWNPITGDDERNHNLKFDERNLSAEKEDSPRPTSGMDRYSEKVTLNIGGHRFTTYSSTLNKLPGTRLATLATNSMDYDAERHEYFFDRNPRLFPYILDSLRQGTLHFPHCLCAPSVRQEMEFWGVPEEIMASCCWRRYREYEEERRALASLENVLSGMPLSETESKTTSVWLSFKRKVYQFLEKPNSSQAAKVWSYMYIFLLVVSVFLLLFETDPSFRVPFAYRGNISVISNPKTRVYITTREHPVLRWSSYITTSIFALELVLRFIVWPVRWKFLFDFYNIVDTISVIPLVVVQFISYFLPGYWVPDNLLTIFVIAAVTSVGRSVRILKLVRHNRALRVLALALQASYRELLLLLMLVIIGMLVFSTAIYYAEFIREDDSFNTIPVGFWWAVITMTTVGYGDVYPETTFGHLVGCACALAGMLITGLPIPVIASNFNRYYGYAKLRDRMYGRKRTKLKKREDQKDSENTSPSNPPLAYNS